MMKNKIETKNAPEAIGPYSQGMSIGDMIFTSGQLPINPESGKLISDNIKEATRQVINNVESILKEAGADLSKVIKTTVYLSNLDDFAGMNEVYGEYFGKSMPARSTIQAAKLPKGSLVEIDVIAHK